MGDAVGTWLWRLKVTECVLRKIVGSGSGWTGRAGRWLNVILRRVGGEGSED